MIAVFILLVFVVLLIQDILFLRIAPKRLDYTCAFDRQTAAEGDHIHMIETVANGKPVPVLWLMADIHTSPHLDYGSEWSHKSSESQRVTSLYTLGGRTKVTRTWNVSCLRRGVIHIEYITLIWGGLLGNRMGSLAKRCDARLTVYPGLVDIDALFTPKNLLQGDLNVRRFIADDPFVFAGLREYCPSDPLNRVHWGATARHGELMVRRNDYTAELTVLVVLNIQSAEFERRESCDPARSELAIKVAASVADRAIRGGAMCALATNAVVNRKAGTEAENAVVMKPGAGPTQLAAINDILARLECANCREFSGLLDELAMTRSYSEIVVVSIYLSDRLCESCEALCRAGNSVKVLLLGGGTSAAGHGFQVLTMQN